MKIFKLDRKQAKKTLIDIYKVHVRKFKKSLTKRFPLSQGRKFQKRYSRFAHFSQIRQASHAQDPKAN